MTDPHDQRRPSSGLDAWYQDNVPGSDWDDDPETASPAAPRRGALLATLVAAFALGLLLGWVAL